MYGDKSGGSAGADLESMGEGAAPGGGDKGGEGEPIHIPAESLPAGIKEGDCLMCTGMDDSGCTFELEAGEGKETKKEGTPWEDDFRQSMSATAPQEGAA